MSGSAKVTGLSRIQTREYTAADVAMCLLCSAVNMNKFMGAQKATEVSNDIIGLLPKPVSSF